MNKMLTHVKSAVSETRTILDFIFPMHVSLGSRKSFSKPDNAKLYRSVN